MIKPSTLIRSVIVLIAVALLAQLSLYDQASWAAVDQDVERQTVPTRTPTAGPVTPTAPTPTSTAGPTPTLTPLPTPTPPQAVLTAKTDTDVYDGPDIESDVIGTLTAGERAIIVGRNFDHSWWQIRYKRDTGWVAAADVTTSQEADLVPITVVNPASEAEESAPLTLPRAGTGPLVLWGGTLVVIGGALLLLMGRRLRRSKG